MDKLLLLLLFGALSLLQASVGTIIMTRGDVKIKRVETTLVPEEGFTLETADVILTGKRSKAQFKFTDETLITVGPDTAFDISHYLYKEGQQNEAEFKVVKGVFKAVTGKIGKVAPDRFKLKTQTANIGIRGTIFTGAVDGNHTEVSCFKGLVTVTTAEGNVTLPPGYKTYVYGNQKPAQPRKIFEATLSRIVLHHPEVRRSIESYRQAKADRSMARSGYLPSVDAAVYGSFKRYNGPYSDHNDDDFTQTSSFIRLRQNLFRGLGTMHAVEAEDESCASAEYMMLETVSRIGIETISTYIELLKHYKLFHLADVNVQNHEKIYAMIKEQTDSGMGVPSDYEQISGRLALANSNLIVAINNYEDAVSRFERMAGTELFIDDLQEPELIEIDPTNALKTESYMDHPAYLASEHAQAASQSILHQNEALFYPSVDLEVKKEWERNQDHVQSGYDHDRTELDGLLIASWNLFNGGRDRALRKKALLQLNQADESLRGTKRRLKEELQRALAENRRLNEQMKYLLQHSEYMLKTLRSYHDEFRLGRRTLMDLLDIETEYYHAMRDHESARFDQLMVKYKVIEKVGGLPELMEIDSTVLDNLDRRNKELKLTLPLWEKKQ